MGFFTRLIAGLVAASTLGAGLAGTAGAVDTTGATGDAKGVVKLASDDTSGLPDHLVNGDFSVNYKDQWLTGGWNWTSITPDGKYLNSVRNWNNSATIWKTVNGWDKTKFGWSSTQKDGTDNIQHKAGAVEIQYDDQADNVYGELCAYEKGTAIYQDIKTVPGTLYKIRLKHASLYSGYLDKMQVMVGTPGHEQAVEMTRTSVNGNGDTLNEKSTTIATKVSNTGEADRNHENQWETYEGTYLIPDGQTTTRFTFRSVDAESMEHGNLLDDIVFDKAYKLSYDKNASDADGEVPSNQRGKENTVQPAKSKTTGTVKTVVDTSDGLSTELVNGDFEYPGADVLSQNLRDKKRDWWGVSRKDKMVYESDNPTKWVSLPSTFDSDRFAWDSSEVGKTSGVQEGSSQWHTNEVELQRDSRTGNMYAELSPYQAQASIRQYIRTTPGALYKVRLKHASLSSEYLDKIQVLIEADGNEQPVRMTRVESQNGLDAIGESTASTTISTHASNKAEISWGSGLGYHSSRNHDGQWATYEGVYVATSDVTVFTFKSVDSPSFNTGNLLDDVVFTKAYKLTYDKNAQDASGQVPSDKTANTVQPAKAKTTGSVRLAAAYNKNAQDATGSIPSDTAANTTRPAKSETDGKVSDLVQRTTTHEDGSVTVKTIDTSTDVVSGCQVYYLAGQRITLATMAKDDDCWDSSMLTRPGHTQLGWNQDRNATQAQAQVTMVEGGMTVYAVWVGNPVLTYDTNKPATWNGQMPSTPASVSVAYNTAAADGSGWAAGDTSKIRGYKFLGWYTAPQDNTGLYQWATPLTGNVTVYAHWQRLQANVVYNANGGTGSHPNTTGWQYSDATIPGDTSKSFKHDGLYRFKHWNTQPNDQGTVYTDGSRIALQDKDITLYAIWVPYHENFVPTGGIGLPIAIAGGVLLLMFGIGSTVMLTRRMNGHGMPDDE